MHDSLKQTFENKKKLTAPKGHLNFKISNGRWTSTKQLNAVNQHL